MRKLSALIPLGVLCFAIGLARAADAALLFLVYPLEIVDEHGAHDGVGRRGRSHAGGLGRDSLADDPVEDRLAQQALDERGARARGPVEPRLG